MSIAKAVVFLGVAGVLLWGGLRYSRRIDDQANQERQAQQGAIEQEHKKTMEKLIIKDIVVGQGEEAKAGDTIRVHYVGTLDSGKKFDSSYDRSTPFEFRLGVGEVISGWDLGVAGMKVGGKRQLTIPPELGYGSRENPAIPANSTLHFTVELLGIVK